MCLFWLKKPAAMLLMGLLGAFRVHALDPTSATISADPSVINAGLFFDGATVTVSGQRSGGRPLLLLIVGPLKNQQIAQLNKASGIWLRGDLHQLPRAPGFLAVAGNRSIGELIPLYSESIAAAGLNSVTQYLPVQSAENSRRPSPTGNDRWYRAYATLLDHQSLSLTELSLQDDAPSGQFKAEIHLPSNAPPGNYQVVAFTHSDGRPITLTTQLELVKTGIANRLERAAFNQPVVYGVAALLFALLVGWLIGVLLNRR